MKIPHQTFAVFGLGKAGHSTCVRLLELGCTLYVWDDNEQGRSKLLPHPNLHLLEPNTYPWPSIQALFLSPGIPFTHPEPHPIVTLAQQNNCNIVCDIEALNLLHPEPTYIGITGTNGKSTTTTLTDHILNHANVKTVVGGNLGIPALDLHPAGKDSVVVLELSSYQLDLIQETHINIACLLNVTPDHLDRHGDMQGYVTAKKRIFMNQDQHDIAFVGIDDPYSHAVYEECKQGPARAIPISVQKHPAGGISLVNDTLIDDTGASQERFTITDRDRLPGIHNSQNIAFAYAMARAVHISADTIIEAIASFPGLAHRIQYVDTIHGIRFVNDSKATNAEAVEKALVCYDNIYWILGGRPKAGGITSLTSYFPRVRHAFLIGEAADEFAQTLDGHVDFSQCTTLDKAVKMAYEHAHNDQRKSPVVLLSPACASWDQFPNFEVRGQDFCRYVAELKNAL
ncbi:MAG: UDP-N-acetylmuramoyl-L-alanine--D-glutamate ligase [Alphaproteobacteria bacterium]|nr:UDP-N-acetylmuramoyl-L-alanine--D-glutamate ligase [Alphaproteobacteria bacterium]